MIRERFSAGVTEKRQILKWDTVTEQKSVSHISAQT